MYHCYLNFSHTVFPSSVITNCPITSTTTPPPTPIPQPFSPSATPPSRLSNKAVGHISVAFRGSLVRSLVSPSLGGNRGANPCQAFKQAQATESTCSWGRMTQLPQRARSKKTTQNRHPESTFGTYNTCDSTMTYRKLLTVMRRSDVRIQYVRMKLVKCISNISVVWVAEHTSAFDFQT